MRSILLRADGGYKTGLGHLYRLLALGDMLYDEFDCTFASSQDSSINILPNKFKQLVIPLGISVNDEVSWLDRQYGLNGKIVVLDGYHFTQELVREYQSNGAKVVFIDDLCSEKIFADVVINHAPGFTSTNYRIADHTQLFLGTHYSLLRTPFLERSRKINSDTKGNSVLICFGGSDQYDFSYKYCKALLEVTNNINMQVVVGEAYKGRLISSKHDALANVNIHRNLSAEALIEVMEDCKYAIVPCSTIFFEICCLRIPSIIGYYAENQHAACSAFDRLGLAISIGNFFDVPDHEISSHFSRLISVNQEAMQQKQAEAFDGMQRTRIINIFKSL